MEQDKNKDKDEVLENEFEEENSQKRRKSNIISFVACVLIAFALWLIIMNATDTSEPPETGDGAAYVQSEII